MVSDESRGGACASRRGETMQEPKVSSPASACALRIVCLFQGAVDAVFALGLQSCLVGRSHHCTGPAPVLALPCVSSCDSQPKPASSLHGYIDNQNIFDPHNINWEVLQELKPDLIFSQGPSRADTYLPLLAHQLTERKCRVVSLQSHTVEDIFQNLEVIASCCDVKKEGAKLVALLHTQWKSVRKNTPQWADGMPYINVAFLSCVNPLIGEGYWVPEIISCAGGLSSFGRAGCPSKSLTLGDLAQLNADVVVYLSYRFHVESLATELSWLFTNKEWKNLKAIKANRLFLIDANRFFIDSAPNVISSTELLTEILHGFGYGHEGKGFIRWQSLVDSKGKHNDETLLQCSKFENRLPALLTDEDSIANYMDVDKHEVCSSASHDCPKYVTNVYEVRKPVSLQGGNRPQRNVREKPDVCDGEISVLESHKIGTLQHVLAEGRGQRCLETKIITPDTVFQVEKTQPKNSEGHVMDWHDDWGKHITEELPRNGKGGESAHISRSPMNSFNVGDQNLRKVELGLAQTQSFRTANPLHLLEQPALGRVASSAVYRYENSNSYCDQQLLSKIWAFTESAAEMRCRSVSSTTKQKVFQKSISLPVSHRSVTGSNTTNKAHLSAEMPKRTNSFFVNRDDDKPPAGSTLCRLSAKDSSLSDGKWDKARASQSSTARRREEKGCPEVVSKRGISYSVPSSPKLDVIPRLSKHIRNSVLKSLVDLKHMDCLLLSGGLASSILAEAVPLVHLKGFRIGFTVLAGPAATDRASAAVAAKCKGMQHVIIGEGEKGFAVFLLAKELAFIVETLKTFDPLQVRNLVPIAAALREAKSRGFEHVVTGDGLNELFSRDGIPESNIHPRISKLLSRSTILLGETLGIKVVQPFLHPKLVQECKAFIRTCGLGIGPIEHMRATLSEAFPEVSAACSEKVFNEVDSGMFYVSDYFSSAISASVLESKAKSIYRKEKICIRDAEHLVYYRAFRRVFKGNVPRGMVRWASKPCSGCGYQLSTNMSCYCLVCGLSQQSQKSFIEWHETEQSEKARQEEPSVKEGSSGRQHMLDLEVSGKSCAALDGVECEEAKDMNSVASVGSAKGDSRHSSKDKHGTIGMQHRSPVGKSVAISAKSLRRQSIKPSKEKKPNYWALLGAGSAGLLLLLQLSRNSRHTPLF